MFGFQPKSKQGNQPEPAQPKLGLIKGKGTGTSDSIKTDVPVGSYIMPADSTEQLGAENLQGLGFKLNSVPINVSNGEYGLPPEQVHAVGVQALDQMKDATHQPVPEQARGFKPEMFFANGGEVEWDATDKAKAAALGTGAIAYGAGKAIAPAAQALGTTSGGLGREIARGAWEGAKGVKAANIPGISGNVAKSGLGRLGAVGALATTAIDTATTPTEQYRERFSLETDNPSFAGDLAVRTLGAASDLGNNLTLGLAGKYYQDKQRMAQEANAPAAAIQPKPATAALPAGTAAQATNTTPNPFTPTTSAPQSQAMAPNAPPAQPLANNVIRDDNSFSGSNIGAGYTINGKPSGLGNPQATSAQNQAAVKSLLDSTPEFGKGFYANAGQDMQALAQRAGAINAAQQLQARQYEDRQRIENDLRMAKSAMPVGGARGQTKTQQEYIQNLQGQLAGVGNQQYDQFKTDATNNAALQKQLLGDQAATARTAMTEAGANSRNASDNSTERDKFLTSNDLENRKFGSDQQLRNFEVAKQQRQQKLYEQYDNAKTPEEKSLAAQQIQELSGKEQANRFTVVPGGQEWDEKAGAMLNRPASVLNNQTGQFVDQGQQKSTSRSEYEALPKGAQYIGEDGKRYIKG